MCVSVCVFVLIELPFLCCISNCLVWPNCFFHFIHVQVTSERDVTVQYIMWVLLGSRTGSISGEEYCTSPPPPVLLITVPLPLFALSHTYTLPLHYTSSLQPHKTERSLCSLISLTVLFLTLTHPCAKALCLLLCLTLPDQPAGIEEQPDRLL